jgi:hypothetical protein
MKQVLGKSSRRLFLRHLKLHQAPPKVSADNEAFRLCRVGSEKKAGQQLSARLARDIRRPHPP